jgi:hypothetical protein
MFLEAAMSHDKCWCYDKVSCAFLFLTILLFSTAAPDHRPSEENSWSGEGSSSSRKSDAEQGFESDSEADEQRLVYAVTAVVLVICKVGRVREA